MLKGREMVPPCHISEDFHPPGHCPLDTVLCANDRNWRDWTQARKKDSGCRNDVRNINGVVIQAVRPPSVLFSVPCLLGAKSTGRLPTAQCKRDLQNHRVAPKQNGLTGEAIHSPFPSLISLHPESI